MTNELHTTITDILAGGAVPDSDTVHSFVDLGPIGQRGHERRKLTAALGAIREAVRTGDQVRARSMAREALDHFAGWNREATHNPVDLADDRTTWAGDSKARLDITAAEPLRNLFAIAQTGNQVSDDDINDLLVRDDLQGQQRDRWRAEVREALDQTRHLADNGDGSHDFGAARTHALEELYRLGHAMTAPKPERLDNLSPRELADRITNRHGR